MLAWNSHPSRDNDGIRRNFHLTINQHVNCVQLWYVHNILQTCQLLNQQSWNYLLHVFMYVVLCNFVLTIELFLFVGHEATQFEGTSNCVFLRKSAYKQLTSFS